MLKYVNILLIPLIFWVTPLFGFSKHLNYNYPEFHFNLPNFYEHYETYSRSLCSLLCYLRLKLKQPLAKTFRS